MVEKERLQIEIIGEAPSKRDYCVIPPDENVRNSLIQILDLESQLSEGGLSPERLFTVMLYHMQLWNGLPYCYKSELADLTAITA